MKQFCLILTLFAATSCAAHELNIRERVWMERVIRYLSGYYGWLFARKHGYVEQEWTGAPARSEQTTIEFVEKYDPTLRNRLLNLCAKRKPFIAAQQNTINAVERVLSINGDDSYKRRRHLIRLVRLLDADDVEDIVSDVLKTKLYTRQAFEDAKILIAEHAEEELRLMAKDLLLVMPESRN